MTSDAYDNKEYCISMGESNISPILEKKLSIKKKIRYVVKRLR